jgi:biotin-dependent carboxylase-like uncharacterized protein
MTSGLQIIKQGLSTTIQDLGRPGYQKLGVSHSGALDPVALCSANALVGNPLNTGAIEALYLGPSFVVEVDVARLAFVGAEAPIEVSDGEPETTRRIAPMQSVRVRRGQTIEVGRFTSGATLYIAVEGGFDIAPVLGSVATDYRGGLGGWHQRPLRSGDLLPMRQTRCSERDECRIDGLDLSTAYSFRTILGPQHNQFSQAEIRRFFAAEYTIGPASNRMGLRLNGPPIYSEFGHDIVSDAIPNGAIQIPGSGTPIVLLADRQTTGGYPKIGTVISADIPSLGRLSIGSKITFRPVDVDAAVAARRELSATLNGLNGLIVPARLPSSSITTRLLEQNLISGVHNAAAR